MRLAGYHCTATELRRGSRRSGAVALTFDGDSDASAAAAIVAILQRRGIHATFFITGHFCHAFPRECRLMKRAGMEIGSHSCTHPYFTRISDDAIRLQLDRAETIFTATFGAGTKPLFRFPYGDSDPRSRKAVAAAGFQSIYWSLDTLDAFGRQKDATFVRDRTLNRIRAGDIVLMHVSSTGTAEALPEILDALTKRGIRVTPVSDFL